MEVIWCKTKEETQKRAAEALNTVLKQYYGQPILFLSSGGSSLELLNGLSLGDHMTISVLDERYGNDPSINNFSKLMTHVRDAKFIDTRVKEGESLQELAQRFEKELRMWKEKNPSGKVIITQGVGSDGHTAGIMPYPENPELFKKLFDTPDHWVTGYDARVTTTPSFLRHIVDHSLVYLVGEQKREALRKILALEGTLWETPGRIIQEMKNVKLFTDIVY